MITSKELATALLVSEACFLVIALFLACVGNRLWHWLVPRHARYERELHFDYRQKQPRAVAVLLEDSPVLALGGETVESLVKQLGKTPKGQAAEGVSWWQCGLRLRLLLPETRANSERGAFQVTAKLCAADGQAIREISRPVMLRHRSPLNVCLRAVILQGPLLLGWKEEAQWLDVPLLEAGCAGPPTPLAFVSLELSGRAGAEAPDVAAARLTCEMRLGLLTGLLHKHPRAAFLAFLAFTLQAAGLAAMVGFGGTAALELHARGEL